MSVEEKIREVIEISEMIGISFQEFIKFDNGTAYVKMLGTCSNCVYSDLTIAETIETILTSEIPEVIQVKEFKEDIN